MDFRVQLCQMNFLLLVNTIYVFGKWVIKQGGAARAASRTAVEI